MKKKTLIASGIIVAVLGSGLVFAGQKNHRGWGGHHGNGGHMMHMIDKLERKLDLSTQQVEQLEQIAIDSKSNMQGTRSNRLSIGMQLAALDPASAGYDTSVSALSLEIAEMAKQKTLNLAAVYKQASAVLTEPQRVELRELIQKRLQKMARRNSQKQEN